MKKVISCVLLMLVLTSNALALEVPTDTVVQNLNGSQQAIKTFTVSPEQDPAALIEEPFELEGYLYTFADIVKSENPVEETQIHTEVITVETTKDDLALILEQLKPTIEYDDGRFQGTLALDHTSLNNLPFSEVGWSSLIPMVQNVLDRYSLLMIDFKYQKSIISRPAKKGGTHGRLQTGRC